MDTAFRSDERFTQSQFFEWLQQRPRGDFYRYELLGGHIVMTPPAGHPHGQVEAPITAALLRYVRERRLGIVCGSSAGFELPGGETVEPDATFVSAARLAEAPKPEAGKFRRVVPDLVVEILSRATARRDRTTKRQIYERNGVNEYWIVAPESRHVSVFVRGTKGFRKPVLFVRGEVKSSLLAGFSIPLDEIFVDLDV